MTEATEEEDTIIVKWAQEDVETLYNLLNNNNIHFYKLRIHKAIYSFQVVIRDTIFCHKDPVQSSCYNE